MRSTLILSSACLGLRLSTRKSITASSGGNGRCFRASNLMACSRSFSDIVGISIHRKTRLGPPAASRTRLLLIAFRSSILRKACATACLSSTIPFSTAPRGTDPTDAPRTIGGLLFTSSSMALR